MFDEYRGYEELVLTDDQICDLYSGNPDVTFGLLQNEYLIARDSSGNDIGIFALGDRGFRKIQFKSVGNRHTGKIKPRNIQQQMAIDMLLDEHMTVKILTGCFGSGKDIMMCSAAVDLLEHNRFRKIVYVRNNIEVKNSNPIGHLPGTFNEKMLPFAMPLADHLGGIEGLQTMMDMDKIEIVHLGFLRGRDIRDSIVICSEAENMTKEHIQLLLGRIGIGSELWINGDFRQCDAKVFEQNNGLMIAVDRLKGHPKFGYVMLQKTERSETAAMADLLD